MSAEKCEGCGRIERYEYCGRFMTHMWFNASNESDSDNWEDWWECSQEEKHRIDHPRDYSDYGEGDRG